MFSKLLTIFICFNIALGSRLYPRIFNNVDEDFVRFEGEAGSDDHSFDSSNSQEEEIMTKQTSCGKPSTKPNTFLRITGGMEAKPHSWPWQVSVQSNRGVNYRSFCGGTIISATKVISAAQCLFDKETFKPIPNLFVIAGIHDVKDSYSTTKSQSKQVIKTIAHNKYNPKSSTSENDIAILYISAPGFTFNDKVQPACLPSSKVPDGTGCYTTGWGNIWEDQPNVNNKLYQVKVPTISQSTCSSWLGSTLKTTMLCAGYPEGRQDSCHGDNGGPLVCNRGGEWVLDGVVSWVSGCGKAKKPGVYTKVYDYISWINSN